MSREISRTIPDSAPDPLLLKSPLYSATASPSPKNTASITIFGGLQGLWLFNESRYSSTISLLNKSSDKLLIRGTPRYCPSITAVIASSNVDLPESLSPTTMLTPSENATFALRNLLKPNTRNSFKYKISPASHFSSLRLAPLSANLIEKRRYLAALGKIRYGRCSTAPLPYLQVFVPSEDPLNLGEHGVDLLSVVTG